MPNARFERIEIRIRNPPLDLSRITNGKLQLQRQLLDFDQAVREACQTCSEPARERAICFHCELADDCGRVDADAARLHGGTIVAESAGPGRGATFTVRLPALLREDAPTSRAAMANAAGLQGWVGASASRRSC